MRIWVARPEPGATRTGAALAELGMAAAALPPSGAGERAARRTG
ncbi:hypothetical protein [Methylobacterium oryzae]